MQKNNENIFVEDLEQIVAFYEDRLNEKQRQDMIYQFSVKPCLRKAYSEFVIDARNDYEYARLLTQPY